MISQKKFYWSSQEAYSSCLPGDPIDIVHPKSLQKTNQEPDENNFDLSVPCI